MTIRPATDADVDDIRVVAEQSWNTDYPDILTRETAESAVRDWYTTDVIEETLTQPKTQILVAERNGTVVGFSHVTWNFAAEEGYILRLYVHPDYRQEGVGSQLLERTCETLAEQGIDRINAMVLAKNAPGNAFYDGFGFEQVDEGQTVIGDESYPENRYVLERPFELKHR